MIIPNTWATNTFCDKIRRRLLNESRITHVVQHKYRVFPDVTVDTQNLIATRAALSPDHHAVVAHEWSPHERDTWHYKQKYWAQRQGAPVNLSLRGSAATLCLRLSELTSLADIADITQGCKPFQVGKGTPPQTRDIVDRKPFVSTSRDDDTFRPLLRGSLIGRYDIRWSDDYFMSFGEWLAEPRHSAEYDAPEKVVIRQTGDSLISVVDDRQFVVRDNLYTLIPADNAPVDCWQLCAILNSTLLTWYFRNELNPEFGEALAQVKRSHLARLPVPDTSKADETVARLGELSRDIHRLRRNAHPIDRALDPFNWLDRGVDMTTFGDAFSDELQRCAELVLGDFNHDVDGLALERNSDYWTVRVKLKKRDPDTDWDEWIKDGNRIVREWVTAYRIPIDGIDERKAVYYQQAFEVIDQFRHFTSFPTAPTRSTQRDLNLSKVPEFDAYAADRLQGLVDRRRRLDELDREIAETDEVINRLVYELYGLTEEQIEIVEGSTDC